MAAALALAACAPPVGGPPPAVQVRGELDQEFRVREGEVAAVDSGRLWVRFVRVTEDSRCPINARCIRAGAAKLEVELRSPRDTAERVIVSTPDEPKGGSYRAYDVEALEIQPGREIGAPTPKYEAVLRVHRAR